MFLEPIIQDLAVSLYILGIMFLEPIIQDWAVVLQACLELQELSLLLCGCSTQQLYMSQHVATNLLSILMLPTAATFSFKHNHCPGHTGLRTQDPLCAARLHCRML